MNDAGRGTGQIKKNEKKIDIYKNTKQKELPLNNSMRSPISRHFGKTAPEKNSTFLYNDINKSQYTTSSKNMSINDNNMNNNILAGSQNVNSAMENTQRLYLYVYIYVHICVHMYIYKYVDV
jgi:hypothetical protein